MAENGVVLAESERFRREGELVVVDVDTERLRVERVRQTSFADAVHGAGPAYRIVALEAVPAPAAAAAAAAGGRAPLRAGRPRDARRALPRGVLDPDRRARPPRGAHRREPARARPLRRARLDAGAARVRAHARPAAPPARRRCSRSPCPASAPRRARSRARARSRPAWGAELREIDIRPACVQHISDIGLDPGDHESITYQNLQARERTQVLMDLANKEGGHRRRHRRPVGARAGLRDLRRRPDRDVQRERERAEDAGAPPRRVGGRARRERARARHAAGGARRRPSRRSWCRRGGTARSATGPRS